MKAEHGDGMNKRIADDVIESVRQANDIVDVVGSYVQLQKQGRNYFGLCPFHEENTPSFSVAPDKQIFHCFGCKKGGNVITFIMEIEGYSFYETLNMLAERAGIDIPELKQQQTEPLSQENTQLLEAHEWLTKLYHHLLKYTEEGKQGYQYLKERGISDESIDIFQLGYAPHVDGFIEDFLTKKGFQQPFLIRAGILRKSYDHRTIDPFQGRVVFPIRNHLGKPVAFSARTITKQDPKYLNSPESDLFHKSRILYNFDLAKQHMRKEGQAILLEGQMDVISAYQAGVRHVVATLGTALTESQAKLLRRYVDTVVICYDSDFAGLEATYRAALLLRKIGCEVKIAELHDGLDPDSYIKQFGGASFLNNVILTSDTYMSFYMRYLKKDFNLNVEADRIQYIQTILNEIAMIESAVEREHYIRDLSQEFELSTDAMIDEVNLIRKKSYHREDKQGKNSYTKKVQPFPSERRLLPAFHNAERQLIAYMLQDRSIADKVQEELKVNFNIEEHKIIVTYLYAFYEEDQPANVSLFIDQLPDEELKGLVSEIAMLPINQQISDQELMDYIRIIRTELSTKSSIEVLKEQQRLAEQANNPIKAAEIAMQIIELQKQLKQN